MMLNKVVVGIDEVGRGPLAGPITVAAVVSFGRVRLKGIKDSKRLSVKKREEWFEKISDSPALSFVYTSVGPAVIDRIGISKAASVAVSRCLAKLAKNLKRRARSATILLDGSLYAPPAYLNQKTIIKGDMKMPIIAAASIIAKVKRDGYMKKYHLTNPKYNFASNKGYGTRAHIAAIKRYGLSPIHRKSFCTRVV